MYRYHHPQARRIEPTPVCSIISIHTAYPLLSESRGGASNASTRTLPRHVCHGYCLPQTSNKILRIQFMKLVHLGGLIRGTRPPRPPRRGCHPRGARRSPVLMAERTNFHYHKHGRNSILSPVKDRCKPRFLWLSIAFPHSLRGARDINKSPACSTQVQVGQI